MTTCGGSSRQYERREGQRSARSPRRRPRGSARDVDDAASAMTWFTSGSMLTATSRGLSLCLVVALTACAQAAPASTNPPQTSTSVAPARSADPRRAAPDAATASRVIVLANDVVPDAVAIDDTRVYWIGDPALQSERQHPAGSPFRSRSGSGGRCGPSRVTRSGGRRATRAQRRSSSCSSRRSSTVIVFEHAPCRR